MARPPQRNGMLLLLALHATSQFLQLEHKPPVTAGLILANVLMFLRPGTLDDLLPSVPEVCLNPRLILRDRDLKRLFLSAFYHVDEAHLVYNMLSLLWKGVQLENRMGSGKFAFMITVLLGMSHGLVVLLSPLLSFITDSPQPLYSQCAVGFSAVLFALKTVLNHNSPTNTEVYGVMVPARYAAWAELLLVHMFVPGSSFLGHLCGILAGLIYINAPGSLTRRNNGNSRGDRGGDSFFRRWTNWSWMVVTSPLRLLFWTPPRVYGDGTNSRNNRSTSLLHGDRDRRRPGGLVDSMWRCSACTYDNPESSNTCDMCGTPRLGATSDANTSPSAPPWPPQDEQVHLLDDIRRARVARFSR